ncbi:MAG: hypothetical protein K0R26_32 [Bacteroidota bacterium]|jgi:peptidoglycan/LPS O-acetylase OafA/YrhL|nr:hypothetical protein [Bacteroidota bacterium]
MPQLDALRAIAAFSVVLFHFLNEFKIGFFHYGWIGVDIFFVISGYLITAILLEQKKTIGDKLLIIRNFIIKRALRLFPAYYLFITIFLILMVGFGLYVWDKGDGFYYYTYTQNILFYLEGMKGVQLNHLWTLAVEEQFYLFWPLITVFVSNRNLIIVLFCFIISALLLKSINTTEEMRMLTFAHFDTLGSGALFALLLKEQKESLFLYINKFKNFLIPLSVLGLALCVIYTFPNAVSVVCILTLSISLVVGCYYNFKGLAGIILSSRVLKYFGGVSYGIYLYHKPIPYFMTLISGKLNMSVNPYFQLFIACILTCTITHLSFVYLEKRFLMFKEKFDL